jgi:O-antigen ligase
MRSGTGEWGFRLRGPENSSISDPNDFGQLVLCVIPLMFILWRAKKTFENIAFVILPGCVLLAGVYLTHSRGALLALVAMAIVAARRRIGILPSLLLAGGLFAAAMALHFTGGRQISTESGSDRTALWYGSLQVLKDHPLFGVGAGNLADYLGLTAHNSIMVCAAELGMVGLYFWSMFLLSTVRDAWVLASPGQVSEGKPIVIEEAPLPHPARAIDTVDKAEVNRLGHVLIVSLTGFLAAGFFLSRATVMQFFMLGGMVEVAFEMALRRGMVAPRMRLDRTLLYSVGVAISLIVLMSLLLRTLSHV